MAHQYIEQLGDKVKAAVFGNVGTLIAFRVGAADAEELVPEFSPVFTEEDIVNLPKFEFYLKLMIDGLASDPFSAKGLPPLSDEAKTGSAGKVIKVCRERYAKARVAVEEKITRWHNNEEEEEEIRPKKKTPARPKPVSSPKPRIEPKSAKPSDNVYKYEAKCSRCGKDTKTSFQPDGVRPVYCKDCLSEVREEKRQEIENRRAAKQAELARLKETADQAEEAMPEISLKEALAKRPVTFSGKDKVPESPKASKPISQKENTNEGEINEGEAVDISS
jgi:CxxC-x17-CxxC domain-containing protein